MHFKRSNASFCTHYVCSNWPTYIFRNLLPFFLPSPPPFSENVRYVEQKKSLASSLGIYNILTFRLECCVCLLLPNFSLSKAQFLFLYLSLSFSLVTVFGTTHFSVVSPDEYSFVSCTLPAIRGPKLFHLLTLSHITLSVYPSFQHGSWFSCVFSCLFSISTLWTSFPPERQFVLLWNVSKDVKHCRSSPWSRQKESTDCRIRKMLEEKVSQHFLL